MHAYISKHILHALVVLLLVSFLSMLLFELVPGDPVYAILGDAATPEQIASLRKELRLDDSVPARYVAWLGDAITGDLGDSPRTRQPVLDEIVNRLPVTLELALLTLLISLCIAIPLGVLTAWKADRPVDEAWSITSSVLISVPHFVSALGLSYLFGVKLQWLPIVGWSPITDGLGDNLRTAILPVTTLAIFEVPVMSRLLRADMLTTLDKSFVLNARSRGLSERYVLFRHALRPSSFALLTLSGLALGRLIGGAIIVEYIFGLPGIGQLMLSSITNSDLVTVQGVVVFVAIAYVLINSAIDVVYGFIDPRVRANA